VPQLGNLLLYNPNAWVADCAESGDRATGWWYRIATPAASGFFVYSIAPGTTSGAAITIAFEERGGDVSSEHFEQGFLTTTVSTDPVSGHTTISGKFSASWGLPAADCRPGLLAECERVEVRGNYFVEHFLQF
jgi:hypothetical protein